MKTMDISVSVRGLTDVLNTKYEFSHTVADGWWMAGSLFGAFYHTHDVTGLVEVNHLDFAGLSFEIEHRIVDRSAGQPFAVSISVEPLWGRLDSYRDCIQIGTRQRLNYLSMRRSCPINYIGPPI